jgi:tetratricopeptide (TPR) repeat protein
MKSWKFRYSGEIALGLFVIFSIIFMIVLNNENIKLRLSEINYILSEQKKVSATIDHAGLIIQYRFRMDLYKNRIDPFRALIIEMRANSMFAAGSEKDTDDEDVSPVLSFAVDFIKSLLGRGALIRSYNSNDNSALMSAYYFERNCLYDKALEKYREALESGMIRGPGIGGIMLHQGFCLSMSGDTSGARNKYTDVIKYYSEDVISITASVLLGYLEEFARETEVAKIMPDSPEKGEKLFYLTAFRDSLAVIETIKKKGGLNSIESANFFKARCLESTGNPSGALLYYQDLIQKNPYSKFAKMANRRIFIIGTRIGSDKAAMDLAEKNNSLIRDENFTTLVREGTLLSSKAAISFPLPEDKALSDFDLQIKEFEQKFSASSFTAGFKGKRVKVSTVNGDIIRGLVIEETSISITVQTIAGDAVIKKHHIVKSEIER